RVITGRCFVSHTFDFRLAGIAAAAMLALAFSAGSAAAERQVERGAYLVKALGACGNCHTPHDAKNQPLPRMELAGRRGVDVAGAANSGRPNPPPEKEAGSGRGTPGQIVNALRNGKGPEGSFTGPPMPIEWYAKLSDKDAEAIAAYLKSLPPIKHKVARSTY